MVTNQSTQWLAQQSVQQAELAEIGFGLATLGMESLARINDLNFKAAKSFLTHTESNLSLMGSADQAMAGLLKAAEQGVIEVQAYVRESAALMSDIQQKAVGLFEEQLGLVKASAENLRDETRKVSPRASEIVDSAMRGWVDGAQSAVDQINQMTAQVNELTVKNTALMGAWQASRKPVKTRANAKALA